MQDVYPIPQIKQILEHLDGKTLFTALDIRWGYHNIRIKSEDQWKAAFKTPFRLYVPNIMFFSLMNLPASFQHMMDHLFDPLKRKYPSMLFVYMDNILICIPDNPMLHEEIMHQVLDILEQESLFLKLSKCYFHQHSI